jgi:glycosyltransferase involved in cell wall biosynthesis
MAVDSAETEARPGSVGAAPLCVKWFGARPAWLALPAAADALERHGVLETNGRGHDLDLARRLASSKPSPMMVLHATSAAGPALYALRREDTYDVVTVDLSASPSVPSRAEARRLNEADLVLIGSVGALRETRRRYPFLAAKTAIFRTPADFAAQDAAQANGEGDLVLFEGPLTPTGGLDLIVEALARLDHDSAPPALLVLERGGRKKRYLEWCQRRAADAAIPLTISSARDRSVEEAYASATIVCAPYRDAVASEPARRAAAAGIPIVGTEVDSLLDLVEDAATGYLVPIDDINGLADRLELLLRDADLRGAFGRAARERAEAELSPAVAVSRLVGLWSETARRLARTSLAS